MKKNLIKYISVSSLLMGQISVQAQNTAWTRTEPTEVAPMVREAGLKPREGGLSPLSNDIYFNYQWALKNEGQSFTGKIGNLYFKDPIMSNPQIQIGWENFDSLMKKEVIVGVLDSGMYATKGGPEDLKENLNLADGKDFVVKNGKTFDDRIGHGTHIAGIIGAKINNGIGIAGVTNKVKIIPLRVYDKRPENQSKENDSQVNETRTSNTITPRVIEAVNYAIEKKMDVLNLSLGWPKKEDTQEVREVFKKAYAAGITIVAAAGNDGNSMQLYPCSYPEVICVGSISLDGSRSNFSNFGNHVDLVAPGQGILSLIPPVESIISNVFGIRGYEIKNGTSQAAPFVAAAAAILKGIYPNETNEEIRNRLLLGALKINEASQFGLLNIKNSINLSEKKIAYVNTKSVEDSTVNPQTLSFEFPVVVYSNLPQEPVVNVISKTEGISIESITKVSQNAQESIYKVNAKVANLKVSNNFNYQISLGQKNVSASLILKLQLAAISKESLEVPNNLAALKTGFLPVETVNAAQDSDIQFWSYLPNKEEKKFELFVWTRENSKLVDRSIEIENAEGPLSTFNLLSDDFDFDGSKDYLLLTTKNSGSKEVEISAIYLDNQLKPLYRFLIERDAVDKQGAAIYSTLPAYFNIKDISLVRVNAPTKTGFLKVPLFLGRTITPKVDTMARFESQKQASLALQQPINTEEAQAARGLPVTELNPSRSQFFYYEPQTKNEVQTLRLRSLTSAVAEQTLRRLLYEQKVRRMLMVDLKARRGLQISESELQQALNQDQLVQFLMKKDLLKNLSTDEKNQFFQSDLDKDLTILGFIPQSTSESKSGSVQMLVSLGRGLLTTYYKVKFANVSNRYREAMIQSFQLPGIDLTRSNLKPVIRLESGRVDSEAGFTALYSWSSGASLVLRGEKVGGQNIEITDREEALAGILRTFTKGSEMLDVVETTKNIRFRGIWNQKRIDESAPVYRTSFLPGFGFSELFQSVIVSERQTPGVMIDSSDIFSNRISIYTLDEDGKMRSSIERSIEIPKNCKARRKPFQNTKGFSTITVVCGEKIEVPNGEPQFKINLQLIDLK
jgi:subtilisin family serine protease